MANGDKTQKKLTPEAPFFGGADVDKPPIEIHVDITQLTFGDLETVANFQGKSGDEVNVNEILPLLNRVVVGGVRNIRIVYISEIMEAIDAAFREAGNPKN